MRSQAAPSCVLLSAPIAHWLGTAVILNVLFFWMADLYEPKTVRGHGFTYYGIGR